MSSRRSRTRVRRVPGPARGTAPPASRNASAARSRRTCSAARTSSPEGSRPPPVEEAAPEREYSSRARESPTPRAASATAFATSRAEKSLGALASAANRIEPTTRDGRRRDVASGPRDVASGPRDVASGPRDVASEAFGSFSEAFERTSVVVVRSIVTRSSACDRRPSTSPGSPSRRSSASRRRSASRIAAAASGSDRAGIETRARAREVRRDARREAFDGRGVTARSVAHVRVYVRGGERAGGPRREEVARAVAEDANERHPRRDRRGRTDALPVALANALSSTRRLELLRGREDRLQRSDDDTAVRARVDEPVRGRIESVRGGIVAKETDAALRDRLRRRRAEEGVTLPAARGAEGDDHASTPAQSRARRVEGDLLEDAALRGVRGEGGVRVGGVGVPSTRAEEHPRAAPPPRRTPRTDAPRARTRPPSRRRRGSSARRSSGAGGRGPPRARGKVPRVAPRTPRGRRTRSGVPTRRPSGYGGTGRTRRRRGRGMPRSPRRVPIPSTTGTPLRAPPASATPGGSRGNPASARGRRATSSAVASAIALRSWRGRPTPPRA